MSDPIVLPCKMPSSAVGNLSRLLAAAIEPGVELRIDAGDVKSIGALAAEQLLRFIRKIDAVNGRVEITGSAEFQDDLRLLGLQDLLLRKDSVT